MKSFNKNKSKLNKLSIILMKVMLLIAIIVFVSVNKSTVNLLTHDITKIEILNDNEVKKVIQDQNEIAEVLSGYKWQFFYPVFKNVNENKMYLIKFYHNEDVIDFMLYLKEEKIFLSSSYKLKAVNNELVQVLNKYCS